MIPVNERVLNEGDALIDEVESDIADNEKMEAAASEPEIAAADGKMLMPIFRMLADGIAPNHKYTDDECMMVSTSTEECINHYWGGFDNVPPWVQLLMVCGMVGLPRLGVPLKAPKDEPGKKQKKDSEQE